MPEKPKREGPRIAGRRRERGRSARYEPLRPGKPQGTRHFSAPRMKPSADSKLRKIFAGIGVPAAGTFQPDPFQIKALKVVWRCDCLVSAPTGSGKTWIAEEAISRILKGGGRAWYASPLKALTNSKYLEFANRFSPDAVGILTGDRKENADAPIMTGTTEILRNQLYDAMHEGIDFASDLVILDEAHFLGDPDRGVVWEEIMIYLPVRVNLLLLSATIGNAGQIADWLESIRSKTCVVVEETERPVPLHYLFLHPSGRLLPFIGPKGMDRNVRAYLNHPKPLVLSGPRTLPPFQDIIRVLRSFDLLPAIFFLKSRADCDGALGRALEDVGSRQRTRNALNHRIDELTWEHPHLAAHRQIKHLRYGAVAAHHGGQLPAWKLLVENLMTEGLLDAVFATSTVAAGVNFPARSVLFFNSDRYNGHEFVPLNATEFHQMTGRAGRRGKDHIGFAVAVPGRYMDLPLIGMLCRTPPEDILSQIKIDFSMVLNVLLSHTPQDVKGIFEKSFATYLNLVKQQPAASRNLNKAGNALMTLLPEALCDGPEHALQLIRDRVALIRELGETSRKQKELAFELSKRAHLVPGRLFLDRRNRMYCAVKSQVRRDEAGMLAFRLKPGHAGRLRPAKLRWFSPKKVSCILDRVLDLTPPDDPEGQIPMLSEFLQGVAPEVLETLPLGKKEALQVKPLTDRISLLERELNGMICKGCSHCGTCHGRPKRTFRLLLEEFAFLWDTVNQVRMRLWNGFVKHLEFLKAEGFVDRDGKLTHDGVWASQLRLDQPLMIAEGLRRGLLPGNDPALLAALVAPFVYDRDADVIVDRTKIPKSLLRGYEKMTAGLTPLAARKTVGGFEVRPIPLWPAATIHAWAHGQSWETTLEIGGVAEGDLAMLVMRTADNLRQIASLRDVYPEVAHSALEGIEIILREPVIAV